jgi:hypothetical protein
MRTEVRLKAPESQKLLVDVVGVRLSFWGALLFLGISGDPREHRQSHTIPNGGTDLLRKSTCLLVCTH